MYDAYEAQAVLLRSPIVIHRGLGTLTHKPPQRVRANPAIRTQPLLDRFTPKLAYGRITDVQAPSLGTSRHAKQVVDATIPLVATIRVEQRRTLTKAALQASGRNERKTVVPKADVNVDAARKAIAARRAEI
jgi:hypothetical protein